MNFYKVAIRLAEAGDIEAYNALMYLIGKVQRLDKAEMEADGIKLDEETVLINEGKDSIIRDMGHTINLDNEHIVRLIKSNDKSIKSLDAVYKIVKDYFFWREDDA